MQGTAFLLEGCSDEDVEKAKTMFLVFSGDTILDTTQFGQIINKATNQASIYINGVRVAEEPNFAFSYNITSLTKQIKKALNRERTNVGRTAYADRIKPILIEAQSDDVIKILTNNLEAMSEGNQCDEIKWTDVASHAVSVLNKYDNTVFVTPDEIAGVTGHTGEIISNSGKRIVFIPESVKKKAEEDSDNSITTINTIVQEYNDSFDYNFIDFQSLLSYEQTNWSQVNTLLQLLGLSSWFSKCYISEKIKEDINTDTVGVWDSKIGRIVIKRSQLKNRDKLFGTVIHEIIHASSGTSDVSRLFEIELTNMIGTLSDLLVTNNGTTIVPTIANTIPLPNDDAHNEMAQKYATLLEKYRLLLKRIK